MFRTPVAEPAHVVVEHDDLIPLSVLALDMTPPSSGWDAFLAERATPLLVDDLGRDAITRDDARRLLVEQRELAARAREVAARQEQQFIEADKAWRAQLPAGVSWWEIPDGVLPVVAMTQAARDEQPRRRSLTEDLLDRRDEMVFHPIRDEEAS